MVTAGYAVEVIFGAAGLIPSTRNAKVLNRDGQLGLHDLPQYRLPLALAAALVWRFYRSGGAMMLKMMAGSPEPATTREDSGP